MTTHVNDVGTWRTIAEVHVKDSSTWRQIQEVYVNDGGTWRTVFVGDVISIGDQPVTSTVLGSTAVAGYELTSGGDIRGTTADNTMSDIGDWIAPKTNMADYEVVATLLSGSLTGTFGTPLSLGTTRIWQLAQASAGTSTGSMLIEIRRISDSVVMDSATISFDATRE
jgi:hypothetical protein